MIGITPVERERNGVNTDFFDAFCRHWRDAETLFKLKRWANAEHLHGIAAECALKRLMQRFGMRLDNEEQPENKKDRRHINEIWGRYSTYLHGSFGRSYALPQGEPFKDWRAGQRYHNQDAFTETSATAHRQGAMQAKLLLDRARNEGLL